MYLQYILIRRDPTDYYILMMFYTNLI